MRQRETIQVDFKTGELRHSLEQLPDADFEQRIAELKASVPCADAEVVYLNVLCNGCGAMHSADIKNPQMPEGWIETDNGDLLPEVSLMDDIDFESLPSFDGNPFSLHFWMEGGGTSLIVLGAVDDFGINFEKHMLALHVKGKQFIGGDEVDGEAQTVVLMELPQAEETLVNLQRTIADHKRLHDPEAWPH